VYVAGDRIKAVTAADTPEGKSVAGKAADQVVDATGLVAAPGFIDCHSHFDWVLPLSDHEQLLFPLVEQGITTVVTGNCGFSPAPLNARSRQRVRESSEMLVEKPLDFQWEPMGEFFDYLDAGDGLLFNNVQLAGHGTVYLGAVNNMAAPPDPGEMDVMVGMLNDAFDSGAAGLSFGLMYPPGLFSTRDELVTMARTVAERGRILTVHIKALSKYSGAYPIIPFFGQPHNLRALEEILSIGLETGVRLQISHFIFVGKKSWPTAEKAVKMVEAARDKGLEVMWDIYPHFCGNSYLTVFLPAWFVENLDVNLDSPGAVRRLKFELKLAKTLLGFKMRDIQIMDAGYPAGEKYNRLNLVEIAAQENIDPVDAMLMIIKKSRSRALQLTYGYSGDDAHEQLIEKLMAHPLCLFETDTIVKSRGFANPATYGAFARILGRFVREKKTLSLSEAVSKMSGKTARWYAIAQRGEIKAGNFADIVLFDPDTIADNTSVRHTAVRPTGIEKVFINGELAVEGGRYLKGQKPGRVVRF
jgi:N-acyl-D-amino-acid deacylase